nr:hypothetical protein [Tanacetum cinerariifolium]
MSLHLLDVSEGEACPTDSSFITDQDKATIAKSSSLSYDSASRVTSPVAAEGSMQPNINELTILCTSLQRQYSELLTKFQAQEVEIRKLKDRVKVLEDREGVAATQSGDDALIKGRSIYEGKAATERISDDSEELARVLTSMDAVTVLAGGIDIPTGSGFIHTAGPLIGAIPTGSDDILTASPVFATATVVTPYSRRKVKEVMVKSDTPKKQRLQEQIDAQVARELEEQQEKEDKRMIEHIARDAEVARIHAEEELQGMIDSLDRTNETIAKYIQEYQEFASELPLEKRIELISDLVKYQDNYAKTYKFQSQQRKPRTKKQKKDFYMAVIRSNLGWKVKDFKGMTFKEIKAKFNMVWKQVEDFIPIGSKEEAERYKRKGIRFDQESSKKLKSSKEVIKDVKSTEEIPEEKMKEMVHTEGQRSYWKIIRLGGSLTCYQFFIDLLKQLDREDLNQLWALVKEYLSIRPATSEKEMELWVELKRLYEPDPKDQLLDARAIVEALSQYNVVRLDSVCSFYTILSIVVNFLFLWIPVDVVVHSIDRERCARTTRSSTICMVFDLKDLFGTNGDFVSWKSCKFPSVVCFQSLKFLSHCFYPFRILSSPFIGIVLVLVKVLLGGGSGVGSEDVVGGDECPSLECQRCCLFEIVKALRGEFDEDSCLFKRTDMRILLLFLGLESLTKTSFLKFFNYNTSSLRKRRSGFAAVLAVLITRASQSKQHGISKPVKCSHWQYKFSLPVKVVATARRLEMPLSEVCPAIKEKKKKLPVKDRWQLH